MDSRSPVLAIIPQGADRQFYTQVAESAGYPFANVFMGTPAQACEMLASTGYSPKYIMIDVGERSFDVFAEIDQLAEYCEVCCRVVALGQTNDIAFYRQIIARGVAEYFTHPVKLESIQAVLFASTSSAVEGAGKIIAFVGAGAGDGSSTIATNAAYGLSSRGSTILVDLDYQYGMIAKNLDIASQYGIKDIFDHPDRGVDATLVERMAVPYNDRLSIIAAPNQLQFMPVVSPETMRDLAQALKQKYDYVVFDLPHVWDHWVASALTASDNIVMVGQLWLKSVTHASRMVNTWNTVGVKADDKVSVIVNRSGAKFKEAVNPKDFERVINRKIAYYVSNDIKTAVRAENEGKTIMELGHNALANQIMQLVDDLTDTEAEAQDSSLIGRLGLSRNKKS